MKKLFGALILLMVMNANTFSQEKGKYALDATLNPAALFDAAAGPLFQMPTINFRYFLAEDLAIRVALNINHDGKTEYPVFAATKAEYEKSSSTFIGITPGIEKHFPVGKLSPYAGAALGLGYMMSGSKHVLPGATSETSGIWADNTHQGYMAIGLIGAIGADYYILDNLYLGAEFGVGYSFLKFSDVKTTGAGITTTQQIGGTASNFSLSSSSGLKIGIRF